MSNHELNDELLAEKFRKEYAEQFHILVRMHLSFVLDLTTEENGCTSDKAKVKKWKLVPFGKKLKSETSDATLTPERISHIKRLLEYLSDENNLKIEGVFRRTGSLNRQNELKTLMNQGAVIDFDCGEYSVHDCASVLKQFLSELSDPLLTESHFPAYCQIAELCGIIKKPTQEEKLLEALQLVLLLLPTENKLLLKDILGLLNLTTTFESFNKMSAENLATLFTPHLLCPRKLSAEQLHSNSQNLSGIIAFMITNNSEIFKTPPKLILDFRVRFEKRLLNSNLCLNESVSDQYAANTVFTFLDRERTAKENESNPTETALAQLYAYIQSLPESSKKRKLVKQFNKENGQGTPLQVLRSTAPKNNKSFGDSIKKHLLSRRLLRNSSNNNKKPYLHRRSSSEEVLNSISQGILSRARLFCTNNCDGSPEKGSDNELTIPKSLKNTIQESPHEFSEENAVLRKSFSEPSLTHEDIDGESINNSYITSTPALTLPHHTQYTCMDPLLLFSPENSDRKSMSPITRSTQRMSRAMQETMMTPRSRKPVLLISGNTINNMSKIQSGSNDQNLQKNETFEISKDESLTSTFRQYLGSREILTCSGSLEDLSFSSRTDDFISDDLNDLSEAKMSDSLLHCLNGSDPIANNDSMGSASEKEFVLKPRQFDENGQPIIFETSF